MKRFLSERNLVFILFFTTLALFAVANYDTKKKEEMQGRNMNATVLKPAEPTRVALSDKRDENITYTVE
jgi:hypothetical protein